MRNFAQHFATAVMLATPSSAGALDIIAFSRDTTPPSPLAILIDKHSGVTDSVPSFPLPESSNEFRLDVQELPNQYRGQNYRYSAENDPFSVSGIKDQYSGETPYFFPLQTSNNSLNSNWHNDRGEMWFQTSTNSIENLIKPEGTAQSESRNVQNNPSLNWFGLGSLCLSAVALWTAFRSLSISRNTRDQLSRE